MFIPGLGAFVRLKQHPTHATEDARIGLAGPIWGMGATFVSWAIFAVTGAEIFQAMARLNAWINLFNLIPIWTLDGGRAIRALSRNQRWLTAASAALGWAVSHEPMFFIVAIAAGARALSSEAPKSGDRRATVEYLALVAACALVIGAISPA
jgi:Zn-dependent protease